MLWLNYVLILLTLVLIGGAGAAIFLHKKRMRQVSLVRALVLANVIQLALMLFAPELLRGQIEYQGAIKSDFGEGAIAAIACLPLLFLAMRAILKDIKLVKSADRLR